MKKHIIFDYSYLYYKYKYALESGRMQRLSVEVNIDGVVELRDVSQIYYSMREIESVRKKEEVNGNDFTISICFDMPSMRKLEDTDSAEKYKSNRVKKLGEEDFKNIRLVQEILTEAGYNCFRFEGYEADDLIHYLVDKFHNDYEKTVIYTPDADLLVNIKPDVSAMRYKATKGYSEVTYENFSEYLSAEMKCTVPYNSLVLFKCTVGDKSDCIDGIKKFGPVAFSHLVYALNRLGINWENCGNAEAVKTIIEACRNQTLLTDDQCNQALEALKLVENKEIPDGMISQPMNKTSLEKRTQAYGKYSMKSLI